MGTTEDAGSGLHGVVYQAAKPPGGVVMFKLLFRKTFLVSWKKYRILWSIITPLVQASINLALWLVFDGIIDNGDWKEKIMLVIFRNLTPMLLNFTFYGTLKTMITEFVSEKESKMKIVQAVNGVPPSVYWAAYFAYFMCISAAASLIWTIMLCTTSFSGTNPLLVFIMLMFIFVHTFCTAAMLAMLFEKQEQARDFVAIFLLIAFAPIALNNVEEIPDAAVLLSGFLPNWAVAWWSQAVLMNSIREKSWSWDGDFFLKAEAITEDTFGLQKLPSPGAIFLVFLAQTVVWVALAYWFEQVWQSQNGTARSLCFCLKRKATPLPASSTPDQGGTSGWVRPSLDIQHMSKRFWRGGSGCLCWRKRPTEQLAVNDMTMDLHVGELFALLGHNGAGKTTAINCITGMLPMTSGQVQVMGISTTDDIVRCRQNLSVCPQDNPLYGELTVDEHLRFFSALRGSQDIEREVVDVLAALGLTDKRHALTRALSGGMKRRLWVATSLIGTAPVVFLDEPTSGMDPSSRRELWTLLLDMKARGRSILFTTHYLEEADVLADRKAVMAKGQIKAMGTSKELKLQFGTGYHLRIPVPSSAPSSTHQDIENMVKEHVEGAQKEVVAEVEQAQASGALVELRFTLPYDKVDSFGPLFLKIEGRADELQVTDYELAMTSLEEVFMRLGKSEEAGAAGKDGLEFQHLAEEQATEARGMTGMDYFKALFTLRTKQCTRGKVGFMSLFFPLGFIVYGTLASTGFGAHSNVMKGTYGLYPGFCLSFAGLRLLGSLVQEREKKISHVMISQGMPRNLYWLISAGHCALQMVFVIIFFPIALMAAGERSVKDGKILFVWLAAFSAPIPASLFIHHLSFLFKSEETAVKANTFISLVFGMFLCAIPNILWNISNTGEVNTVAMVFHTAGSFLNPFYLLPGAMIGVWRASGSPPEDWDNPDEGTNHGLSRVAGTWELWAPFVGQLCLSVALVALAYWRERALGVAPGPDQDGEAARRDDDVLAEEARVHATTPQDEACLYRNLHHTFADKERTVRAVRGISLGIKKGECFGLLGPNGAGKTTTLGCLTGEIRPPTRGEVFVAGHSVTGSGIQQAYEHLGNCPQIDPLWDTLSGKEILCFYGQMKGVAPDKVDAVADTLLQRLGIEEADRKKNADKYSGGMKRKLSLGIALIGRSSVLFLDEPSAAVDAGSKRLLWQVIKMRAKEKTVVITTHSMEEAEAVCDRIAIQVLGQLRCLGTPIHLKSKYGNGYQLEVRLKKQNANQKTKSSASRLQALTAFVQSSFTPDVKLLESHEDCHLYQLPPFTKDGLSLGKVFTRLQESKQEQELEDFSLAQPSLEQVFLRFAREQEAAGDAHAGAPGAEGPQRPLKLEEA